MAIGQREIYDYIKANPGCSAKEIADAIGKNQKYVNYKLRSLFAGTNPPIIKSTEPRKIRGRIFKVLIYSTRE